MDGAQIPLGQLAKVVVAKGAPGIRTENALLSAYIYVKPAQRHAFMQRFDLCMQRGGGVCM